MLAEFIFEGKLFLFSRLPPEKAFSSYWQNVIETGFSGVKAI